MPNKYYHPGQHRATRVSDLFAKIARRYDLINDLQSLFLHRWWKRRLIKEAALRRGERALDLCCGTGDIAYRLASRGARVTGLDFSAPMLSVALQRQIDPSATESSAATWREGVPVFLRGDAQHIPFSAGSFEVITVAYGLRNLARWEQGVEEMWRVATPGARLLVLDFGKPDNACWRWVYFAYLRCFVPVLGLVFAGDVQAYSYILESLRHFPAQRGVAEKFRALGGKDVRVRNFLGGAMSLVTACRP